MSCPAGGIARGARVALELADIFREHPPDPVDLSARQRQAVNSITRCRTAERGWRVEECDQCGHHVTTYNSCLDRHCPKCQGVNQVRWVEARLEELLPVGYFHAVFTVHPALHPFFRRDPVRSYDQMFRAVADTLMEVAANPKRLGARIGIITVLHTWSQTLGFHPHIHCVIPGGGISLDGEKWVPARERFLLPVKVLSVVFRGKLLSRLERGLRVERSRIDPAEGKQWLRQAARGNWNVYCKRPFTTPDRVLKYLGMYTHRIAISNRRLVSLQDGQVTFRYRDRKDRDRQKQMTLPVDEFERRFLQHVMPRGFVRIRYYGFLANAVRKKNVARCRELIARDSPSASRESPTAEEANASVTQEDCVVRCPRCHSGTMRIVEIVNRIPAPYRGRGPPGSGGPNL